MKNIFKAVLSFAVVLVMVMAVSATNAKAGDGVTLDVLFWDVDSNNYDHAIEDYWGGGAMFTDSDVERVEPGYKPGLRLVLIKETQSGWSANVGITYFRMKDGDNVYDPNYTLGGTQFHSDWSSGLSVETLYFSKAKVEVGYYVLDIAAAKPVNVGNNVEGNIFFGLRVADINNEMQIYSYDGSVTGEINKDDDFLGFGIRAGFDSKWKLGGGGLHVLGGANLSLLNGTLRSTSKEWDTSSGLVIDLINEDKTNISIIEMAIGVGYETERLLLAFGYELTDIKGFYKVRFPDDVIDSTITNDSDNLSFSGFFVRGGLKFN